MYVRVEGASTENLDNVATACIQEGIAQGFDEEAAREIVGEILVELVETSLYRWSRLSSRSHKLGRSDRPDR